MFRLSVTVVAESRSVVGFPHIPTVAKMSRSSVKLCFLLREVY